MSSKLDVSINRQHIANKKCEKNENRMNFVTEDG